jgi:hypothetical protein
MNWQFVSQQVDKQLKEIRLEAKNDVERFENFGKFALRVTQMVQKHKKRQEDALEVVEYAADLGGKYDENTETFLFKKGEDLDYDFYAIDKAHMAAIYNDPDTRADIQTDPNNLFELISEIKTAGTDGESERVIRAEHAIPNIDVEAVLQGDMPKQLKNEDIVYFELFNPKTKEREPSIITPVEKALIDKYGKDAEIKLHENWGGKYLPNPKDPDGPEIKAYQVDPVSATFAALSYVSGVSSKTKAARKTHAAMTSALKKLPAMRASLQSKLKDIGRMAKIQTDKFKGKATDISAKTEGGYSEVMRSLDDIGRKQGALTSGETERMIDENLAATLYAGESAAESTKLDWDAFNLQVDQSQDAVGEEMAALSAKEKEWRRKRSEASKHNKWYKNLI